MKVFSFPKPVVTVFFVDKVRKILQKRAETGRRAETKSFPIYYPRPRLAVHFLAQIALAIICLLLHRSLGNTLEPEAPGFTLTPSCPLALLKLTKSEVTQNPAFRVQNGKELIPSFPPGCVVPAIPAIVWRLHRAGIRAGSPRRAIQT